MKRRKPKAELTAWDLWAEEWAQSLADLDLPEGWEILEAFALLYSLRGVPPSLRHVSRLLKWHEMWATRWCQRHGLPASPQRGAGTIKGRRERFSDEEIAFLRQAKDSSGASFGVLVFLPTPRGFLKAEFMDRYETKCSLQESSLASEAAIWLGVDDPRPQLLVEGEGWQEVPLPEGAEIFGRMHLTQEMVAALLPALRCFAETGHLPSAAVQP